MPAEVKKLAAYGYYYCYRRVEDIETKDPFAEFIDQADKASFHCSFCNSNFEHSGARFQHYENCLGLKMSDERVAA